MYFVYILQCRDGSLYTGITTDLTRRLAQHKSGEASRYTRSRRAGAFVHAEEHPTRSLALKREAQIKSWPRAKKLSLIQARKRHKKQ